MLNLLLVSDLYRQHSIVQDTLFASENQYQYSGLGLRLIHKYIYKAVLRIDNGINLDGFKNASLVLGIDQFF